MVAYIEKKKDIFIKYAFMVLACVCYAVSTQQFKAPNNIVSGGITGIATMFNIFYGWDIGLWTFILNVPILFFAIKQEGWRFVIDCLITVGVLAVITNLFSYLPAMTNDALLASVYAGLIQGIGTGLFLKYRVSSGGTELLGRLVQKKTPMFSIQAVIAVMDAAVILAGTFILQNPENMLFTLIIIFISTKVADVVIMGFSRAKMVYIVTNYPVEVSELLMHHLKRGVTKIDGTGMYTGVTHSVLLTCIKRNQIQQIKSILKYIDSHAFVIVSDASEVYGAGFRHFGS